MVKKVMVLSALVICLMSFNPAYGYFITSQGDSALTGATVDDFSGHSVGVYSGGSGMGGVYFALPLDNHLQIDSTYSGNYNMTGQYLDNGTYVNNGFTSAKISFDVTASAFGFHWGASEYQWTLAAYDASANLLESYNMPITYSTGDGDFYGIAAGNMAYALLTNISGSYDWVMIDDLSIKQGVAPVPGAVWLLGSGLVGLLALRRKFSS